MTGRAATHGVQDLAEFQARMDTLWEQLAPPGESGAFLAHTDGACLGNPDGPGGWGASVESLRSDSDSRWDLWGHLTSTTNNRAEMLGLLAAIEWMPAGSTLRVRSDSEYTLKVLQGIYKAKANRDLWDVIRATIAAKKLRVQGEWVRGHAGDAGNERADRLAVLGAVNGDERRVAQIRSIGPTGQVPTAARARKAAPPDELAGLTPRGPWEEQFLASIAKQLRGGRALSEKQRAIVERIRERGTAPPA